MQSTESQPPTAPEPRRQRRAINDVNIDHQALLPTPQQLKRAFEPSTAHKQTIAEARSAVNRILLGQDSRLLVIVGPCSIHDGIAAREYAQRLAKLAAETDDTLLLVMRAYFEKPRSTVGWKGLINDPDLDDSFDVARGLAMARELLLDITELHLPIATEALDPIVPQYLNDLISWSAIGARTAESQTHREMASGLSCAVGFKNGTDGGLEVAINALGSVASPHRFLGITQQGEVAVIQTRGNALAHIVLRGGSTGPNYSAKDIQSCSEALAKLDLVSPAAQSIVVDCSHANSAKKPELQPSVARDVVTQIEQGNRSIVGLMLESHLHEGKQALDPTQPAANLTYGQSVTDGCIGWEQTEELVHELRMRLGAPLARRHRD